MAREARILNYRGVKELLDTLPPLSKAESTPLPTHENIRGNNYYK